MFKQSRIRTNCVSDAMARHAEHLQILLGVVVTIAIAMMLLQPVARAAEVALATLADSALEFLDDGEWAAVSAIGETQPPQILVTPDLALQYASAASCVLGSDRQMTSTHASALYYRSAAHYADTESFDTLAPHSRGFTVVVETALTLPVRWYGGSAAGMTA